MTYFEHIRKHCQTPEGLTNLIIQESRHFYLCSFCKNETITECGFNCFDEILSYLNSEYTAEAE